MAFRITPEWIIDLPEEFKRRVENGELVFWKTGITVVTAVFRLPYGIGKLELLNQIQQKMPENTFETLVSTQGAIVGLGYTRIEQRAGKNNRLSLYTFTASDTSCLQTAFYLDDPADLEWAKAIWNSILYQPPANAADTGQAEPT